MVDDEDILAGLFPQESKQIAQVAALRRQQPQMPPAQQMPPAPPPPQMPQQQQPMPQPGGQQPAEMPPRDMAGGLPLAAGRIADLHARAGELRKQAYGTAPDPQMMAQARQEADRNARAGAVIQMLGGSRLRGAGAQVLQQALGRQSELELNPERELARRQRSLEAEAQALERQAQYAQTVEDRRELQREADQRRIEAQREARADRAAISRELAAGRAEARGEAAAQRQEQANWRFEDNARNHFDQITKPTRDVLEMSNALRNFPQDGKLSPVQQQSLVIMLNKFQDPGSVVREGEFDRVMRAQGLLQRWGNLPQMLATGQQLPPALVKDIQSVIREYTIAAENTMRTQGQEYVRAAKQRNLDPTQVVTDPRWRGDSARPGGESERGRGTRESPIKITPRAEKRRDEDTIKVDF